MISRIVEFVTGAVLISLPTHYLGVKGFGEYAFIGVVSLVFMPIISWGTFRILIRDMSVDVDKTPALLTSGLAINGLMTIVVVLAAAGITVAFQLNSTMAISALYLAILSQVLIAIKKTIECVFVAREKMIYVFLTTFLARGLSVLFFLIAIKFDFGMIGLFAALVASNTIGFLSAFSLSSFKFARPQRNIDVRHLIYVFKESFPVAISTFLSEGYTYISVFFLKIFQSVEYLSLFQAPQRIIAPLLVLPSSFLVAFVPTLSRLGSNDSTNPALQYAYHKTFKYLLIFTLPIAVFGTIYAPWIVSLLFPSEFSKSTIVFRILIWTIVPLFESIFLSFILTSIRKQKVLVISNIACFVSNCALSFIFVRKYGYVGASVASLLSYFVLFAVNFYFTSKYVQLIPIHFIALRPLLACGVTYLLLFALESKLGMVPLMTIAFLLYFVLLFLSKTFTPDEIEIFKSAVSLRSKSIKRELEILRGQNNK
jgi:O-antigen/teichoic acid export membrane protein